MELHEELREGEDYHRRNKENKSRLAHVAAKFVSTGQGTFVFEDDPVEFGLTFIEEPFMVHGCRIDLDVWESSLDHDPYATNTANLPAVTGFVTDWIQDDRGFYTGAHIAVSVWFPLYDFDQEDLTAPVDSQPEVTHYCLFHGIAIKDVPVTITD